MIDDDVWERESALARGVEKKKEVVEVEVEEEEREKQKSLSTRLLRSVILPS